MNQSNIIAITGGIGTGKSLVTKYLRDKGHTVIDFDEISRDIYLRGKQAYREIVTEFGEGILNLDGEVDRKKLANIVFSDKMSLEALNTITHKYIFEEARGLLELVDKKTVFLDIPLLYEVRDEIEQSGIHIDEIWLVYSERDLQVERVMKRDKVTHSEAIKRVDAQVPTDRKLEFADKIICNDEDISKVYAKVDRLLENY